MKELAPIKKPKGIFLKLVYFVSKRRFGKVILPISVVYARNIQLMYVALKIDKVEKKLSLSRSEVVQIRNFVAQTNDCSFCSDLGQYYANKDKIGHVMELLNYRSNNSFSAKTKAMLRFVDEIVLNKRASEEAFTQLAKYYNEQEIVEITWVCATEHYFNLLAKPLGIKSDNLKQLY